LNSRFISNRLLVCYSPRRLLAVEEKTSAPIQKWPTQRLCGHRSATTATTLDVVVTRGINLSAQFRVHTENY